MNRFWNRTSTNTLSRNDKKPTNTAAQAPAPPSRGPPHRPVIGVLSAYAPLTADLEGRPLSGLRHRVDRLLGHLDNGSDVFDREDFVLAHR
jgi:hypothetical protein